MDRSRDAAQTQVLEPVTSDEFDEFIDDEDTWDDADDKIGTTPLLWLVAGVLAGVLVLTFVMIDQVIDALPAPVTRSTVTSTEVSTRQVTTVQTATVTTTATPTRDRARGRDRDRDNDSRVHGGAGGESARARQDPRQPDPQRDLAPGERPVEVTAPVPLPGPDAAQDGAGALARTFGDGAVMAGRDVVEGTYRNAGGANCEWTFRRGNEVLDSGRTTQSFAIDLAADGAVFISRGCGAWTLQS